MKDPKVIPSQSDNQEQDQEQKPEVIPSQSNSQTQVQDQKQMYMYKVLDVIDRYKAVDIHNPRLNPKGKYTTLPWLFKSIILSEDKTKTRLEKRILMKDGSYHKAIGNAIDHSIRHREKFQDSGPPLYIGKQLGKRNRIFVTIDPRYCNAASLHVQNVLRGLDIKIESTIKRLTAVTSGHKLDSVRTLKLVYDNMKLSDKASESKDIVEDQKEEKK